MGKGICVGIDLGTTYSAIAHAGDDGKPRILVNGEGCGITPSVVTVREDGSFAIGSEAKALQKGGSPSASLYKRFMGDPSYKVRLGDKDYQAKELSSIFLRNLIADVSEANGVTIESAVITVPAYFTDRERTATREALLSTGVKCLGLLNEPSAAAYSYGLNSKSGQTVLIYDLGGGTFDVTLAELTGGQIKVLATDGNHRHGGADWDEKVGELILDGLCEMHGVDSRPALSIEENGILAVQAEQAKRDLTARTKVKVPVNLGGLSGVVEVTREDFEVMTKPQLELTTDLCEKVLLEAGISWQDVDNVVLVGGSTRMPQVSAFMENACGKRPISCDPDEAVAKGAAVYAHILDSEQFGAMVLPGARTLVDATAHAMGMIAESGDRSRYFNSVIIPKNAQVPCTRSKTYEVKVPSASSCKLEVYVMQGSEEDVFDNEPVGKYEVLGIASEGRGDARVEVTYAYTQSTTVEVTAKQVSTGRDLEVRRVDIEDDLSRFRRSPLENDKLERTAAAPLRVMLCIDTSGSMWGRGFDSASQAVDKFLEAVEGAPVEVGLMCFADSSGVVAPMGSRHSAIRKLTTPAAFRDMDFGVGNDDDPLADYDKWLCREGRPSAGSHGLVKFGGLKRASAEAPRPRECLLLLTDGVWYTQRAAVESAKALRDKGVQIIGIGVAQADLSFLRTISTSDDYAGLLDFSQLGQAFSSIGRALATGGVVRV